MFSRCESGSLHLQEDPFKGMCCARLRNCIWKLTEDPDSSTAAKVLVCVSSLFLLTSIIMLILSTVPEFQVRSQKIVKGRKKIIDFKIKT